MDYDEEIEYVSITIGKDRNLNIVELLCASCARWFHESCISYQLGKLVPFMTNYLFICKNCSPTGLETFKKNQAPFPQMCVTALANLQQESAKAGTNKVLFSKDREIIPFIDQYWEAMTTMPRRVTVSWYATVQRALQKDVPALFVAGAGAAEGQWGLAEPPQAVRPNYDHMIRQGQLKVTDMGVATAEAPCDKVPPSAAHELVKCRWRAARRGARPSGAWGARARGRAARARGARPSGAPTRRRARGCRRTATPASTPSTRTATATSWPSRTRTRPSARSSTRATSGPASPSRAGCTARSWGAVCCWRCTTARRSCAWRRAGWAARASAGTAACAPRTARAPAPGTGRRAWTSWARAARRGWAGRGAAPTCRRRWATTASATAGAAARARASTRRAGGATRRATAAGTCWASCWSCRAGRARRAAARTARWSSSRATCTTRTRTRRRRRWRRCARCRARACCSSATASARARRSATSTRAATTRRCRCTATSPSRSTSGPSSSTRRKDTSTARCRSVRRRPSANKLWPTCCTWPRTRANCASTTTASDTRSAHTHAHMIPARELGCHKTVSI